MQHLVVWARSRSSLRRSSHWQIPMTGQRDKAAAPFLRLNGCFLRFATRASYIRAGSRHPLHQQTKGHAVKARIPIGYKLFCLATFDQHQNPTSYRGKCFVEKPIHSVSLRQLAALQMQLLPLRSSVWRCQEPKEALRLGRLFQTERFRSAAHLRLPCSRSPDPW